MPICLWVKLNNMKKLLTLLLVFGSLLLLVACTSDPVITLKNTDKDFAMVIGEEKTVKATVNTDDTLEWKSDKPTVVTVDNSGKLKAIATGTANITISVKGTDVKSTIKVTVNLPLPTKVIISGAGNIVVGETLQLTSSVEPALASQNVEWTSADEKIATVDQNGKVTGLKAGSVKIRATTVAAISSFTPIIGEVTISIVDPDPTGIVITGAESLLINATADYTATVAPSLANQGVTWTTNDATIATIDENGKLTAVKAGTVKVIATSKVKATIMNELTVTIVLPDATSVEISGNDEVLVSESIQFSATITPLLADQKVTWATSDATIATIDANGKLTAIKEGTVKVIATSVSNSTIKAEKTITVNLPLLVSLTINGSANVFVGENSTYTVTPSPQKANSDVTWSTSDSAIATIDETGKLTVLAEGTFKVVATSTQNNEIKAELEVSATIPSSNILVDANLTKVNGETITYGENTFIVGVNAFKTLNEANTQLKDNSTIYLLKGTYAGVIITKNNISILGPNKGISASEALLGRSEEAIITGIIDISNTEGFLIDGVALTGNAQIYATKPVKNVTIQNVNSYQPNVPAGEGVVFFGVASNSEINEGVKVYHSSFVDTNKTGFRGLRVNNAKDAEIKNNYFWGFYDTVRYEGTANGTTGPGVNGFFIVEDNKFEMNIQYPIIASTWTATSVEINNNYIGVDPTGTGTYGIVHMNNYQPKADVKSIVNITNNYVPYNTEWHEFRTNSGGATASQLEYNVNYNIFNEIPALDGTTSLTHIADHSTAATDFIINGKNNVFKYTTEVKADYFLKTDYEPYYSNENEIGALFVNNAWNGSTSGSEVTFNTLKLTYGTNGFATLQDALAQAKENDTIFLLPGSHAGNVTVSLNNIKITSYNGTNNPNKDTRSEEAIYTGVITLAANLAGFEISGIKFTENAQILNTLGTAGTSTAVTKNLNGFTFKNNIVESGLASGKGFIYFAEAASSYSHNLVFENNSFTVKAAPTTLLSVIYIDNNAGLRVTGNVFKDIASDAFYVFDKTKGLAGNTFVEGNEFTNISGNGFWVNWFSPLPATTMSVKVVNNKFTNIGKTSVYFGSLNNNDVMETVNIQYNVFDNINEGVVLNRVHATANIHVNFNIFRSIATTYYIKDNKQAGAPTTLDAKYNLYLNNGEVITPEDTKFGGAPEYTTNYKSESEVPVYAGEGEIVVTKLEITPIDMIHYVGDLHSLELVYSPTNATTKEVTWSSSNQALATVDANGKVTLLSAGKVTITATSVRNPQITATYEFNVVSFENIEIRDSGNGVVEVGKTTTLTATVYPSTVTGEILFSSSNSLVATVSSTGVVTGVSEGTAVIEVKLNDIVSTITIVVSKAKTTEIDPLQFIMDANISSALIRNVNTFGNTTKSELVNGSVSKLWFDTLTINEALMPGRPKIKLTSLEFIVVHDTGNNNVGADGAMHAKYLQNNTSTSWHYTVDDTAAYYHIPHDEVGYHAGDGLREFGLNDTGVTATTPKPVITISTDGYYELNGVKSTVAAPLIDGVIAKTNQITPSGIFTTIKEGKYFINNTYYNSTYKLISNHGGGSNGIGIESCVDEGSDLYATWQNLAQLVAKLLVENGLGLDRVMQHNNFSGKNCPQALRTADLWNYFMDLVTFQYNRLTVFKDYTFTFVSNNPSIVDNSGKVISAPRLTTEVSYTVTITNNSGYNKQITLFTTIPGTKLL